MTLYWNYKNPTTYKCRLYKIANCQSTFGSLKRSLQMKQVSSSRNALFPEAILLQRYRWGRVSARVSPLETPPRTRPAQAWPLMRLRTHINMILYMYMQPQLYDFWLLSNFFFSQTGYLHAHVWRSLVSEKKFAPTLTLWSPSLWWKKKTWILRKMTQVYSLMGMDAEDIQVNRLCSHDFTVASCHHALARRWVQLMDGLLDKA